MYDLQASQEVFEIAPIAWMHAWHLIDMDWRALWKVHVFPMTVSASVEICTTGFISEITYVSYTMLFKTPLKKESRGDKSGDQGGGGCDGITTPNPIASKLLIMHIA